MEKYLAERSSLEVRPGQDDKVEAGQSGYGQPDQFYQQ